MNRRRFLASSTGLASIALLDLLARERELVASPHLADGKAGGGLHHPPRAKRVIQLFMSGAASHLDTFDHKPKLHELDGKPFDPGEKVELFQSEPGACFASPWRFRPRGECGKFVSDLVPHIGEHVDRIAFLHSMTSKSNVHGPATFLQGTGFVLPGFPSLGAWVSYALGRIGDDLPSFVALPDARGFPPNGPANWGAGFLPATHQGTMIRPARETPIHDLFPPDSRRDALTRENERDTLELIAQQDRAFEAARGFDDRLAARISAYELAARLQLSAPAALDVTTESERTRNLYGLDDPRCADFGRNCLIARRLLERGVRFVQVWSGADNGFPRRNWDSHEDLYTDHGAMAASMDRPTGALLSDLADRGMLDDTLVMWVTEFGRMPCSQGGKGRDHDPFGFTVWLAGGGVKGGVSYGETDEFGYKAVVDPTDNYDLHATVLHLLGIDHERLTVRRDGIDRRLTDVHGKRLDRILA